VLAAKTGPLEAQKIVLVLLNQGLIRPR
jgi:hypothetical protein